MILDVDPRHGGHTSLHELTQLHGPLPLTLTAQTGGGGLHIWLEYTGPTRGALCPGVDIKTWSGYVIVPPSLHTSGNCYVWLTGASADIAPAPGWVVDLLQPPPPPSPCGRVSASLRASAPALTALITVVLDAQEGNRNRALYWAARRMFGKVAEGQLAEHAAFGMLLDAAIAVGLPDREARGTIASARRAELG